MTTRKHRTATTYLIGSVEHLRLTSSNYSLASRKARAFTMSRLVYNTISTFCELSNIQSIKKSVPV